MKRAGRIFYNLAMGVSLLLCVGTVGVWVRSIWVDDTLCWSTDPRFAGEYREKTICSARGGMQFSSWRSTGGFTPWIPDDRFFHSSQQATQYPLYKCRFAGFLSSRLGRYSAIGFEVIPEAAGTSKKYPDSSVVERSLTLPLYFPTLLFALLPAHYFLRFRRRRRIAARLARGCCGGCGYDLRASAGRCPECGLAGPSAPMPT